VFREIRGVENHVFIARTSACPDYDAEGLEFAEQVRT
jgi:hypothetical protein